MSHPILPSKFAPKSLVDSRPEDKERLSADTARDVAAFLAAGGKITYLPAGHSKETPMEWANTLGPLTQEYNQIRAGKDAQKFSIRTENRRAMEIRVDREPGRPAAEYACKSCGDTDEANRCQRQHKCIPCSRATWVEKYGKGKRPMESL